jgi:formylglycine-generating enzyme required for sulfatase activity
MLVMGENPSRFKNMKNPVEQVSWNDCRKFIGRLNKMVPGGGFRLPTEAEWEYACRAGTTTRYSFGDDEGLLGRYAWYDKNSGDKPHEVGTKEPNPWGLYDMHGNVWEWCQDWIGTYRFPAGGIVEDPVGPESGQYRVLRGGAWHRFRYDGYCRSASRVRGGPDGRHYADGFRLARTLK